MIAKLNNLRYRASFGSLTSLSTNELNLSIEILLKTLHMVEIPIEPVIKVKGQEMEGITIERFDEIQLNPESIIFLARFGSDIIVIPISAVPHI